MRQSKQKEYLDRGAKDLPPLILGTKVTVRNHKTGTWESATVIQKTDNPHSYIVTNDILGATIRRNQHPPQTPKTHCVPVVQTAQSYTTPKTSGQPSNYQIWSSRSETSCV